jgi:hypothetical protein
MEAYPAQPALTELRGERRPQAPDLNSLVERGVDHDKLRSRIDENALAVHAEQPELTPAAGQQGRFQLQPDVGIARNTSLKTPNCS